MFWQTDRASAQGAGPAGIDTTFNSGGIGFDTAQHYPALSVNVVAVQPDGKILAGGNFTNYNGTQAYAFVRLNTNGTLDTTFMANLGTGLAATGGRPEINAIYVQPDGKILIGGDFTSLNGVSHVCLARVNSDGTPDTSFPATGTGLGGGTRYVVDIALQPDGKIIVGGFYSSINGTTRSGIARLLSDGTPDTTFNPGAGAQTTNSFNGSIQNGAVQRVRVQPDGKIVLAGAFIYANSFLSPGVARLNADGSVDGSFSVGTGFDISPTSMGLQDDGGILVGGLFTTYNGSSAPWLVRLTSTGTLDTTFASNLGTINGWVGGITIQPDARILIGGRFTNVSGAYRGEIARLESTGLIDTTFTNAPYSNDHVYAMAVQGDGRIVVGGLFTNFNNTYQGFIARLNGDFSSGAGKIQFANTNYTVVENGGTVTIGVVRYGGISGAASVNFTNVTGGTAGATDYGKTNGTLTWASGESGLKTFSVTITNDASGESSETIIYRLASVSGASLTSKTNAVITIYDDDSAPVITQSPQSMSVFATDTAVFTVGVQPGATTYYLWQSNGVVIANATNAYFAIANVQTNYAATYSVIVSNAFGKVTSSGAVLTVVVRAGTIDSAYAATDNGLTFNGVLDLEQQSDGRIVASGNFSATKNYLMRLGTNGLLDTTFPTNSIVPNNSLASSAMYANGTTNDGKILIAGTMSTYAGIARNAKVTRILTNGEIDLSFTNNISVGQAATVVAIQSDDKVLVGYGNGSGLFRYQADGTRDTNFGNPFVFSSTYIQDLVVQPDGKIVVAVSRFSGSGDHYIRRLNSDGTLDATFLPPIAFNASINKIGLQSDGKVVLVGSFTNIDGGTYMRVARLNADGSIDSSFSVGTGASDVCSAVLVQSDGHILVGGWFQTFNGSTYNRVVRLNKDGSVDTSFYIGSGANSPVNCFLQDSVGRIYVGGQFTTFNGQSSKGVARLLGGVGSIQFTTSSFYVNEQAGTATIGVERILGNSGAVSVTYATSNLTATAGSDYTATTSTLSWADGETGTKTFNITIANDSSNEGSETVLLVLTNLSFGANYGGNAPTAVLTILDNDSRPSILVQPVSQSVPEESTVTFSIMATSAVSFTYQWRSNTVAIPSATNATFTLLNVQSNYAANYSCVVSNSVGTSNSVDAVLTVYAAAGRVDTAFNPGVQLNGRVRAVLPLGDGRALVGGDFTAPANRLALLTAAGALDSSFTNVVVGGGAVYDIARDTQGRFYIGGYFTNVSGLAVTNLVRLNTNYSIDTNFSTRAAISVTNGIYDIEPLADGRTVIVGAFLSMANKAGTRNVARLAENGSLDTTFISPIDEKDNTIYRVAYAGSNKIIVGGDIRNNNSPVQNYLARLNENGSGDTFNTSFSGGTVNAIAIQSTGRILAGGAFTSPTTYFTRLNTNGSYEGGFFLTYTVNGQVNDMVIQDNGKVMVVGNFTSFGPGFTNRIARVTAAGTLDTTTTFGTNGTGGFNSEVNRLALDPDGKMWVGGNFTTYKGSTANFLIRLYGEPVSLGFTQQPLDQTVEAGATATFKVTAFGSPSPTYQWYFNGVALTNDGGHAGVTTATLTINNTVTNEAGSYTVQIASSGVTRTSSAATLKVLGLPQFLQQPASLYAAAGTTVKLEALVTGASPITYQWKKDGGNTGTGVNTLTFAPIGTGDAGNYVLVVSNSFGSVTSSVAVVVVQTPPGTPSSSFPDSVGTEGNTDIRALAIRYDGKILIGGTFNNVVTNSSFIGRTRVALLNVDGSTTSFNPSPDQQVNDALFQPDGKALIAGSFTSIAGVSTKFLARFNADMTFDTNFNAALGTIFTGSSGFDSVNAIALQSDGKIYVAGRFVSVNGVLNTAGLVRLNSDGSVDTSFASPLTSSDTVNTMALQPDGKLLIGVSANVKRLLSTGAKDPSFTTTSFTVNQAGAIAVQPDGKIVIGGNFVGVNGDSTRANCVRLNADGTVDSSFNPGTFSGSTGSATISAVTIEENGKILVGGDFIRLGGPNNGLTRLNADGSSDTTFDIGLGCQRSDFANGVVRRIVVDPFGRLWISGNYTYFNSVTENGLTLLSGDPLALAFIRQPALVSVAAGQSAQFIAQATGTSTISYQWYKDGIPLDTQTATNLVIGSASLTDEGSYTVSISNATGGVKLSSAAQLTILGAPEIVTDPLGGLFLSGYGIELSAGVIGASPMTLQWLKDGTNVPNATNFFLTITNLSLTHAGQYQLFASNSLGTATSGVASVSVILAPAGAYTNNKPLFLGPSGTTYTVAPLDDGRAILGGQFTTVYTNTSFNSLQRGNLALIGADGKLTTPLTNASTTVYDMVRQSDGKIVVVGNFTTIDATNAPRLTRFTTNLVADTNFIANVGTGPASQIVDVAVMPNDQLVVVGSFSGFNGKTGTTNIVRLNADGTVDTNFVSKFLFSSQMAAVAVQPDGKILMVGSFFSYGPSNVSYMARLNTDGTLDSSFNVTLNNQVNALAVQKDGRILIGGQFTTVNGYSRPYLARLESTGALDTNFLNGATVDNAVTCLALQKNGRIIVGGQFTTLVDSRTRLGRLESDGSLDTTFVVGGGLNNQPQRIVIDSSGRIHVVGSFGQFDGATANNYIVLNGETPPVGVTYAAWIALQDLAPADQDPTADPDGDGFNNAIEYAFGTDPADPASVPGLDVTYVFIDGVYYPGVFYTQLIDADDATILVDASSTVTFSSTSSLITVSSEDQGDGTELVILRSSSSKTAISTLFFRARVIFSQ